MLNPGTVGLPISPNAGSFAEQTLRGFAFSRVVDQTPPGLSESTTPETFSFGDGPQLTREMPMKFGNWSAAVDALTEPAKCGEWRQVYTSNYRSRTDGTTTSFSTGAIAMKADRMLCCAMRLAFAALLAMPCPASAMDLEALVVFSSTHLLGVFWDPTFLRAPWAWT